MKAKLAVRNIIRLDDFKFSRSSFIRMDRNERNFDFNKIILKKILSKIKSNIINSYPDYRNIYNKLSKKLNIPVKSILLSPGSDAALKYISETFFNQKDKISFFSPTYKMIEIYSKLQSTKVEKIFLKNYLKINDSFIKNIFKKKFKALYISNPNQPIGSIINLRDIKKILDLSKKKNSLVIIDEAYIDFCPTYSAKVFLKKYKNLIILRTFSKAYGLAGLRIGYILSNKENIKQISKVKPLCDVNSLAVLFAEYFLKYDYEYKKNKNEIKKSKRSLEKYCKIKKISFLNSYTNFVYVDLKNNSIKKKIIQLLMEKKILVKNINIPIQKNFNYPIRITLGSLKNMKKIKSVLNRFF